MYNINRTFTVYNIAELHPLGERSLSATLKEPSCDDYNQFAKARVVTSALRHSAALAGQWRPHFHHLPVAMVSLALTIEIRWLVLAQV